MRMPLLQILPDEALFFGILYIIAMIGSLLLGVTLVGGTSGDGSNPQTASTLGLLFLVIGALLLCLPIAVMIRVVLIVIGALLMCLPCRMPLLQIAYIGSLLLGGTLGYHSGTSGDGLNPQAFSNLGLSFLVIGALLTCLPIAVIFRDCYRKDPTQAIRVFSIVLGMCAAAIAGSFVGIELDLFIGTVFWQFLFLTTSTITWFSLVGLEDEFAFLATIIVWPFLMYQIYKKSASFVDCRICP